MQIETSGPLRQIIRYEQQLKNTSQKIEVLLLDDNPSHIQNLRELIQQEEQLVKYLQVESSKLTPQSKLIYIKNLQRYKKKSKEHRDFISTNMGKDALPQSQQAAFLNFQRQNAELAQNKLTMYENQRVQDSVNTELYYQGQKLYGGIDRNREIRGEAEQSENSIRLIQLSIMKRKIMFGSLIVLFLLVLLIVIIMKARKSIEWVSPQVSNLEGKKL